ncbi:MAG TPA: exo-alpha-sialidase [Candidatus Dormibacteraeota bacterium]
MTSRSDGWANGAVRTTDGGAHWQRLAPGSMLSDAPKGTDPKAYPPGYVDYFLDSDHAWLAYSYPSTTSCFDHVTVFSTANGGQSWIRSRPVDAAIQADSSLQLQLDFIDAQNGWLMVLGEGRIAPDWFVYTTTNGGLDWQLLSQVPLMTSFCSVEFISRAVGFLGDCQNTSGPIPALTVTRDGGKTWGTIALPASVGNQFNVSEPVFFNQEQGIVHVNAQNFQGNTETPSDYLAVTSDGGQTWAALPQLSIPGYAQAFAFIDINHFFAVVNDGKGQTESIYRTADGGRTWSAAGDLPPLFQSYPQVMFIDSQHGFVDEPSQRIGDGPLAFLSTSDGGRTWRDEHPQVS